MKLNGISENLKQNPKTKSSLIYTKKNEVKTYFNKDMNFYICSYGGCGSTILFRYLSLFGNVYHIHDRYPPNNLKYIGKENTDKDVYSEWFNDVEIPKDKLKNYKVIFIYRHPIPVIFSRFGLTKPNVHHLKNIKCDNNGNIKFVDVIKSRKDLYKVEDFFDNYTIPKERNYDIYAIKYELFWNNISLFNKLMGVPDIKELYPVKSETPKKLSFINELNNIYRPLINKMKAMGFIEVIKSINKNEEDVKTI